MMELNGMGLYQISIYSMLKITVPKVTRNVYQTP